MSTQPRPRRPMAGAHQRGQAMILTVLLLAVGVGAVVFTLATPARTAIENDKKTAAALAQARDALIGYAASDNERPGSLPCPDTNNDGSAESPIPTDCSNYIGRLPWRTLRLPDLRDGSGERLWYAVSREFARNPLCGGTPNGAACPLNSDTSGQLTITGLAPAANVIAIVFAPGEVIGAQMRGTIVEQGTVSNYLEGENSDGIPSAPPVVDTGFTTALTSPIFNDKLLAITSDALFSVVEMRVLRELRAALRAYRNNNGYFPSANPYADVTYACNYLSFRERPPLNINLGCAAFADWGPELPAWFGTNNWHHVTHYVVSPCRLGPIGAQQPTLDILCKGLGDIIVDGASSIHAIAFAAGRTLPGQSRSGTGTTIGDYLDPVASSPNDENVSNSNLQFVSPVRSATNNDRMIVVWP